jgi:dTDP-4-dehydrorhamnose reductase
MSAIRAECPLARLVHTEDLGYTRATPALAYQAEFENVRRWASLDLICGRLDRHHPLRPWLCGVGVAEAELDWFLEHRCVPDVIGCNYYVTSERFLDDRLAAWPAHSHGGNGRDRYADVEAVRACGLAGVELLLREAWARYGLPLALTEVHLGCTRDEQLRWLRDLHAAARRASRAGIPVLAVTAWALFGTFDWHRLATCEDGVYEPGAFDIRGPAPRPTAVAALVGALARGARFEHPAHDGAGWWERGSALGEAA